MPPKPPPSSREPEERALDGTARRVEQARKAAGLTEAEAAALIGVSQAAYCDLESYDDEMETCLSLREVRAVGSILGADPVWLLTGRPSPPVHPLPLFDVVASIRAYLAERRLPVSEFEDLTGWGVSEALEKPAAAWDWNVDGLRDLCDVLGLDYRAVLLAEDGDAGT